MSTIRRPTFKTKRRCRHVPLLGLAAPRLGLPRKRQGSPAVNNRSRSHFSGRSTAMVASTGSGTTTLWLEFYVLFTKKFTPECNFQITKMTFKHITMGESGSLSEYTARFRSAVEVPIPSETAPEERAMLEEYARKALDRLPCQMRLLILRAFQMERTLRRRNDVIVYYIDPVTLKRSCSVFEYQF
ncbi:hypothetical protein BG005_009696 [Podila minutissima]|nr:hypothetical protein BG005_009696 [Podila minutissima]